MQHQSRQSTSIKSLTCKTELTNRRPKLLSIWQLDDQRYNLVIIVTKRPTMTTKDTFGNDYIFLACMCTKKKQTKTDLFI